MEAPVRYTCCCVGELMNNMRMKAVAGLMLAAVALPSFSAPPGAAPQQGPFELFSANEAAHWNTVTAKPDAIFGPRDLGQPGVPNCHSAADGSALASANPQIKILAPSMGKPLNAPIDIELQFVPAGDALIKPETFRVCYLGFMTIDITQRITDRVSVSAEGIHVTGAQLPHGHHHLMMLIADTQGHLGRREAVFDIE
jgi:hypothetical protein